MDEQQALADLEKENDEFRMFLKAQDPDEIDAQVFSIQLDVTAEVDCTKCGNCCRTLMINVEPEELEPLVHRLQSSVEDIKAKFIEESSQGQLIINTIPCHFLEDSKCTIYESRFTECREFPHLHKKGFTRRLFGTFMHYERCAIISGTIERLKSELSFSTPQRISL
jgi:Fe-S-cluster containining protein